MNSLVACFKVYEEREGKT